MAIPRSTKNEMASKVLIILKVLIVFSKTNIFCKDTVCKQEELIL